LSWKKGMPQRPNEENFEWAGVLSKLAI
jgi:hypothetical protein